MPALSSLADPSIYQNIQQKDGMSQISDLLDVQRKGYATQREKALLAPSIAKGKADSETAVTGAESARAKLQKDYFGIAADEAGGLVNDPRFENIDPANPKSVNAAGDALATATDRMIKQGVPPHLAHSFTAPYFQMLNDPKQSGMVRQNMLNSIQARIGASGQQGLQTPQYTTNQTGNIVGLQSGSNTISAPRQANQPMVQSGNPQAGAPVNLNPSKAQASFSQVMPEVAGVDIAETNKLANGAEGRIAVFQNIKKLAPDAFTSTGGARKELISGIAQAVGIDAYTLEKTATDELAKNTALLTLAGGNTDMARQIAEMANPNKKMTKDAILGMANQLIGVEKMNKAKADFLGGVQDPAEYNKKMETWRKVSDFRIFQEVEADDVKKLKASMSIADQKAMDEKIKLARELGIL